jgi:dTDP-4-dehydrorhamnose 3,5-epimerase
MEIERGEISEINYFTNPKIEDDRGFFLKLFVAKQKSTDNFLVKETFMSVSKIGVLRGMHMQVGAYANNRIISVTSGKVLDVIIDLRLGSSSFGKSSCRILDANAVNTVLVPKYVAHGFQALEVSTMHYISDQSYSVEHDLSINPLSFGFEWPIKKPQISLRDESAIPLEAYLSRRANE